MIKPAPGLQVIHDGRPVEFLYLIRRAVAGETWRVRLLFVTAPDADEFVKTGAQLTPLHSDGR